MGESGTTTKAKAARVAAGGGAVLSLGASLIATAAPAGAASFEVTSTADAGPGSLRQAILDANANGQADTITFAPGLGTITLSTGHMVITDDLVITDPEGDVTIDADGTSRIFYIGIAGEVTLSGLTLTGGDSGDGGAVLSIASDLTITDSTITGNLAENQWGGGVTVLGGTATIAGTTFDGNDAYHGGALAAYGAEAVTIEGSTFSGNDAAGVGGGAMLDNVLSLTVTNSTFTGNEAAEWSGGAISGGGLDALTVTGSIFSGNTASANGGAIGLHAHSDALVVVITGSTFEGNDATYFGGGLYVDSIGNGDGSVTISTTTFSGNRVEGGQGPAGGGAIYLDNAGTTLVETSTISGNDAPIGGGILADRATYLTVVNSTISGNEANYAGGGIFDYSYGDTAIAHATITGNRAGFVGGGVFLGGDGDVTIDHTILDGNEVDEVIVPRAEEPTFDDQGSAIFAATGELELEVVDSVTLTNNLVNGTIAGEVVDGGGNQFDVAANLGPLADNGGLTQTHDLLAGSAALDTGDAAFAGDPTTDQRGLPRVSNGRIDIGAVEVQVQEPVEPPVEPPVTPPATPAQPVPAQPSFTG